MAKTINKKVCANPTCNKEKSLAMFYVSSDLFFFPDGKLNVCKDCCTKMMEEEGFNGFQSLMRMINKPILKGVFKGDYKAYITVVNSLPHYKTMTFIDSDVGDSLSLEEMDKLVVENNLKEITMEELEALTLQFGEGLTEKDYIYVRDEYEDYTLRYEVEGKALEDLIIEIVLTKLEIRNKRARKENVGALQKTLQDLLGSSNLKPVQETGANSVEQETFSTMIKKWENEAPIPEPAPEWKDVDNIERYIKTFFTGHMARLMGKLQDDRELEDIYNEEIGQYTVTPPSREDD